MKPKVQYQVILLVVAILTILFVFPMLSYAAPQGYIQGYVMDDSDSPQAIEGALVEADGVSTTTEANGYYFLTLPEGTYTVTASMLGYISHTVSGVTVTKNIYTDQDFTLGVPPGYLQGYVKDDSDPPQMLTQLHRLILRIIRLVLFHCLN